MMHATSTQAILHIGDMKCGSTSIQQWIAQDADTLRANGIWRSDVTRVVHYDSRLSSYALDDHRLDVEPRRESRVFAAQDVPAHRQDIERRLTAEVAALPPAARAMIFSHELMLSLHPQEVERLVAMLRRLFAGIRVIAYIRRQDRLFLSLWGQRLKRQDPGPYFLDHLLAHRRYLTMLETWERAVGREHLVVRIFDKAAFAEGDLQADFRDAAGIPPDDRYAQPLRTNESLDAKAQSLLLELGDWLSARQRTGRRRLLARLKRAFQSKQKRRAEPMTFPMSLKNFLVQYRIGKSLMPSRAWAEQVMAACATGNEEIRRRYFPDRARLFDDDFSDYPLDGDDLGPGVRRCDPDVLRHPAIGRPEPDEVAEAYRVVLGRDPGAAEIEKARLAATNIAHLYATLLYQARAA